jgi:hypothetical protein
MVSWPPGIGPSAGRGDVVSAGNFGTVCGVGLGTGNS